MTLAREVQWLRATPTTTPVNPRPQAMEIKITRRMWGMPMTRSIHQEITASTQPPKEAERIPRTMAAPALTKAVSRPIRMLRESPARVRASMFRPIQSVPKGNKRLGARSFCAKSVSMARSSRRMPESVTAARIKTAAIKNHRVVSLWLVRITFSPPPFECGDLQRHRAGPPPDFPRKPKRR